VTARVNHHDHQAHDGSQPATHVSNAGDARFGVTVHNLVDSANGINTLKHAAIRSLHNELCPAESEHSRTLSERVRLISLVD
jgi:hypothetical protein